MARPDYLDYQAEITAKEREKLVNWLVLIQVEFRLLPETLFITVNIIDRYLSHKRVPIKILQLLGIAALFIASKFQEIYPPILSDLIEMTRKTYTSQQLLAMETKVLQVIEFDVNCSPS